MDFNFQELSHRLQSRKNLTIMGLAGVAAVHIMDLPGKWSETRYLAFAYIGIIVAAGILIERLILKADSKAYLASAALSLAVIAGFVVNRTVGMPGAMGDIGNWFEPLGLLSLFIEAFAAYNAIQGFKTVTRMAALRIN